MFYQTHENLCCKKETCRRKDVFRGLSPCDAKQAVRAVRAVKVYNSGVQNAHAHGCTLGLRDYS